jgi:hypothetical protein
MVDRNHIYVFNADKACFASAVFTSYRHALLWIKHNYLTGILTEYPLNMSCYDWAIRNGHFKDRSPIDRSPVFIASFVSSYQKNWHFRHGDRLEKIYTAIQN